jgi:hypothetical protein
MTTQGMLDTTGRRLTATLSGFHTDGRRTDDLTPPDASALARSAERNSARNCAALLHLVRGGSLVDIA